MTTKETVPAYCEICHVRLHHSRGENETRCYMHTHEREGAASPADLVRELSNPRPAGAAPPREREGLPIITTEDLIRSRDKAEAAVSYLRAALGEIERVLASGCGLPKGSDTFAERNDAALNLAIDALLARTAPPEAPDAE